MSCSTCQLSTIRHEPKSLPKALQQRFAALLSAATAGKAACKAALQRELGLPEDASVPLLGFIGRLDFQKGPDVVLEAIGDLASRGLQVCAQQLRQR